MIKVTSNKEFIGSDKVKEFLSNYETIHHATSLIAVSLIDPNNKSLEINMEFDTQIEAKDFLTNTLAVVTNYNSIKTSLRSWSAGDKFLPSYDDKKLEQKNHKPISSTEYLGNMYLVDVVETDVIKVTFHRWADGPPRQLTIKYLS